MPHDPYKSLYIHIPFCKSRCNYCDFCTRARDFDSPEIDEYVDQTIQKIRQYSKDNELSDVETIYIGGGTPTFIGNKRLSSLLYAISTSINLENIKEFSIEANPESVDKNLINDTWALGVNRISMGVQSFDDNILLMLGRAHNSNQAIDALSIIENRFDNFSVDLMCGIPGQTIANFKDSLQKAVDYKIPHISIYPLSIEPNTVFYKWAAQNRIDNVDNDAQADHMELASKILERAGYSHYEVASYALKGFECKHNLSYWQSKPYIGIGDSATTMTQNSERRMRVTDEHVEDDLNAKQMLAEDMMLSMRTKYGCRQSMIDKANNLIDGVSDEFDNLEYLGLVKKENDSYIPTKKGWLCGNDLYSKLLELGQ